MCVCVRLQFGAIKRRAAANQYIPAKVKGVRIHAQKADQGVEFAHAILERSSREAPLVERGKRKDSLGGAGGAGLDVVRFIQYDTEPRQLQ